jgi:hypothetical protein
MIYRILPEAEERMSMLELDCLATKTGMHVPWSKQWFVFPQKMVIAINRVLYTNDNDSINTNLG